MIPYVKHSLVVTSFLLIGCDPSGVRDDVPGAGIGTLGGGTTGEAGEDGDSSPVTATTGVTAGGSEGGADTSGGAGDDGPKFDLGGGGSEGTGGAELGCDSAQDEDRDMDGWSKAQGDCNDCDANVNPGAIEVEVTEPNEDGVVPDPADEDCDGSVDNVPEPCDGMLAIDGSDPFDAAGAIGLCDAAEGPDDHGIVSANWVRADGTVVAGGSVQHGLLPGFGPNVAAREGTSVLGISSGAARIPGQAGACGNLTCYGSGAGTPPAGFPQDVPSCPGLSNINDDYALEVTLRAPTNATGFQFDFDFYSFEYPEWVCTEYNDQFIALVSPPPEESISGNISFDAMGNPVSVNIAFFDVCSGCALGTAELAGTGFDSWDDAGATSWLTTTSPIEGGTEFTIRFAIWDTGDSAWDSTVLIDNFQWIADGGTVDVGTNPAG